MKTVNVRKQWLSIVEFLLFVVFAKYTCLLCYWVIDLFFYKFYLLFVNLLLPVIWTLDLSTGTWWPFCPTLNGCCLKLLRGWGGEYCFPVFKSRYKFCPTTSFIIILILIVENFNMTFPLELQKKKRCVFIVIWNTWGFFPCWTPKEEKVCFHCDLKCLVFF